MKRILTIVDSSLEAYPKARRFLVMFHDYCNAIDDIIDEEACKIDSEFILSAFMKAAELYTSEFYRENSSMLYSAVIIITHQYADSVNTDKKELQRVLKSSMIHMLILVVTICCGYDIAREISLKLREIAYDLN